MIKTLGIMSEITAGLRGRHLVPVMDCNGICRMVLACKIYVLGRKNVVLNIYRF